MTIDPVASPDAMPGLAVVGLDRRAAAPAQHDATDIAAAGFAVSVALRATSQRRPRRPCDEGRRG